MSENGSIPELPGVNAVPLPAPSPEHRQAGWRSLDVLPEESDAVEGLMASGRTTQAEWWGPVPEELQSPDSDGSGWAYAADLDDLASSDALIAWRPAAPAQPPGAETE